MKTFEIKKILIPIDFSQPSLRAINPAVSLAKLTKAEITLIHVIDILPSTASAFYYAVPASPAYENDLIDVSNQHLNELAQTIKKKGIEKVNIRSVTGRPHKEIVKLSKKIKADIIIMSTHGASGFTEFFIGSNTSRVVSHALCPVLSIQKHITKSHFKDIIVPFRYKLHSREKVDYAIFIAKMYGATLHVLGVDTEGSKSNLRKMTLEGEKVKKSIEVSGVKCKLKVVSESYLADSVLKYAKTISADLIIITSDMDKVSVSEYFMGPFAQQIVNHSPIPVLSIRPAFKNDTNDLPYY